MIRRDFRLGWLLMLLCVCVGAETASATTVTLAPDRGAPQPAGTMIRWTASATGGTAPYSFKWWLYNGATWQLLRDWNTSSTFEWTPAVVNSGYRVGVWVRSAGNSTDVDEANEGAFYAITAPSSRVTSVSLVADRTAPQPIGTTIRWTATASGGTTPHSFKWWLYNGTSWQPLRDWNTSPTFEWSPSAANSGYRVGVWVRSAGSTSDADEANDGVFYAITAANQRVASVSLTADRAAPQPTGSTIVWTAHPSGGAPPYSYKWWLHDGAAWQPLREWSANGSFAWLPTSSNSAYRIGVWVRGAGNASDADEANQSAAFAITPGGPTSPSATAVTLRPDRPAPQLPGTSITWTAETTGGAAPHSYKWWLFDGTKWTMLRDWTTDAALVWTPTSANAAYRVGVWARSSTNASDVDEVNQSAPFSISSAGRVTAVTITADRTAPQSAGTTIRWTAAPTNGVGPISYKWWLFDGARWEPLSDWATADSYTWTPSLGNVAYKIGVWARSAPNQTDSDEANISQPFAIGGAGVGCVQRVSSPVVTVGSGGGTNTVQITTASDTCSWEASSQASWVSVTSSRSGSGPGNLTFRVAANTDSVTRTGSVTVGGQSVSVSQAGASGPDGCSYAVFPTTLDVGFGNGTASVAVTAPSGCAWVASGSNFVHAASASGVGSATVNLTVENSTAAEPRAAVLTVAGRAVTVMQAGRSVTPQGCTFDVSPSEVSVGFDATTHAVSVAAPSGCSWTATSSSAFLHITGASSGSGAGTLRFAVDTNGSTARSGVLLVAGRAVTVAQSAASTPPCVFALSSTSAQVSHAGGAGALSVMTSPECRWEVSSRTEWLRVTASSGPYGDGSVWFDVDPNDGSERAGTLVVAGQTFTVAQAAPPVTASADTITWALPPDDQRVGECAGNCGAGCGTFFNPCGGPHYWEHTVLTAPEYVGDDWEPVCSGSSSWFVVRPRYTAVARWTYHGLKSSNCQSHDATCRALGFLPTPINFAACLATAGLVGLNGLNYCDDAQPFDWSYEFVDIGHGAPVAYIDGAPSCD